MWEPVLAPGPAILSGNRRDLRHFCQELAHEALQDGDVLWCDGDHGFNPYDFAEVNLTRGLAADHRAEGILIKRCMTPFQWDTVLTKHLDTKLLEVDARVVIIAPFDRLFSTDELQDWEQEDYVRYAVTHIKNLARRHLIPILLAIPMHTWWKTHPTLAQIVMEAIPTRWTIDRPGRWRAVGPEFIDTRRQVTLLDYFCEAPERAAFHPLGQTPLLVDYFRGRRGRVINPVDGF